MHIYFSRQWRANIHSSTNTYILIQSYIHINIHIYTYTPLLIYIYIYILTHDAHQRSLHGQMVVTIAVLGPGLGQGKRALYMYSIVCSNVCMSIVCACVRMYSIYTYGYSIIMVYTNTYYVYIMYM